MLRCRKTIYRNCETIVNFGSNRMEESPKRLSTVHNKELRT